MNCADRMKRRRRRISLKREIIWMAAAAGLLLPGMAAAGMDMGGFDVSVGEGEGEIPAGWEADPGESASQENDSEEMLWGTETIENTEQNWNPEDVNWNGNADAAGDFSGISQGIEENSSYSFGDDRWQKEVETLNPPESAKQAGSPNPAEAVSGAASGSETDAAPTPVQTPTSVPALTKAPDIPETLLFTATPEPLPTVTPAPGLSFYRRHSDEGSERTQLSVYYHKETAEACEKPQFLITGKGTIHILSVRINGAECPWHWKENLVVIDTAAGKATNCVELLALYEAGEEIRIKFQTSERIRIPYA